MNDQRAHWDKKHEEGGLGHVAKPPSELAVDLNELVVEGSRILELGCGVGIDAGYFALKGHDVVATDFSEVAIEKNQELLGGVDNLEFKVLDIREPFPFGNEEFASVYAMLSLHYFPDRITKTIFEEIYRVLEPKGLLSFVCKSTSDPLFGKGRKIERDMFEFEGHVRHFFSKEYVKECLGSMFKVVSIEEVGYIKVMAEKK